MYVAFPLLETVSEMSFSPGHGQSNESNAIPEFTSGDCFGNVIDNLDCQLERLKSPWKQISKYVCEGFSILG